MSSFCAHMLLECQHPGESCKVIYSMDTLRLVLMLAAALLVDGCQELRTHDCQDMKTFGHNDSGVYHIIPAGTYFGFDVFCDMDTDGGGWLVFQRREDGSVDFYRDWDFYQLGFGSPFGEFWLGNLLLYIILRDGQYEMRLDLEDFDGKTAFAKYKYFEISGPEDSYRMTLGGYSGNAGDNFKGSVGKQFTTKDRDNDVFINNCAEDCKGGWWYESCHYGNPNGLYFNASSDLDGLSWWSPKGSFYFLKKIEMKIRRR